MKVMKLSIIYFRLFFIHSLPKGGPMHERVKKMHFIKFKMIFDRVEKIN